MTTTTMTLLRSMPTGEFPITPWQARTLQDFAAHPARAAAFAKAAGSRCLMCSTLLIRSRWVPFSVDGKRVGICSDCTADFPSAVKAHRLATVREVMAASYETASKRDRVAHARRLLARPPRASSSKSKRQGGGRR